MYNAKIYSILKEKNYRNIYIVRSKSNKNEKLDVADIHFLIYRNYAQTSFKNVVNYLFLNIIYHVEWIT